MKTELQQLTEAKLLLFELAEEMERDGYETLPKKAKQWLKENGPTAKRTAYPPNAGTQRPGTSDAEPATRTPMPGSLE